MVFGTSRRSECEYLELPRFADSARPARACSLLDFRGLTICFVLSPLLPDPSLDHHADLISSTFCTRPDRLADAAALRNGQQKKANIVRHPRDPSGDAKRLTEPGSCPCGEHGPGGGGDPAAGQLHPNFAHLKPSSPLRLCLLQASFVRLAVFCPAERAGCRPGRVSGCQRRVHPPWRERV